MPAEAPPVTLLGPQRRPRLDRVLRDKGLRGRPIALVNAGWQERESEDELLSTLAGGQTLNVRLWQRMQQVWEADPELAAADRHRREVLTELQELYLVGLRKVREAIAEVWAHEQRHEGIKDRSLRDAERVLRDMDARHLQRIEEIYQEFWDRWAPHHRESVATVRGLVARELAEVEAVVIPGGHVGVLANALHLFAVGPQLSVPVVAWGAGAMALTDRVVLFHDHTVHGPAPVEMFTEGIALVHDVVALPSPRERLDLADTARMGVLARRFAPARCLLLEARVQVDIGPDGALPPGAPVLGRDGRRTTAGEAA